MSNLYTYWLSGDRLEIVGAKVTVEANSSEEAKRKIADMIEFDRYDRKILWEHVYTDVTRNRKIQSRPLEIHPVLK